MCIRDRCASLHAQPLNDRKNSSLMPVSYSDLSLPKFKFQNHTTVSYTHLDVYKRQEFLRSFKGCAWRDAHYNKDIRKELNTFNSQDRIRENVDGLLIRIGCRMADCVRKFINRSVLDKEVYQDIGRVGEMGAFPLGPEQAIRLFPGVFH